MNEKLKEFVEQNELLIVADCEPEWSESVLRFAQAVYDFAEAETEKRVLTTFLQEWERSREEFGDRESYTLIRLRIIVSKWEFEKYQRLSALQAKAGKEKGNGR